jgi:hypothetical protein
MNLEQRIEDAVQANLLRFQPAANGCGPSMPFIAILAQGKTRTFCRASLPGTMTAFSLFCCWKT